MEGEESATVCLDLVSLTGPTIENAMIGFTVVMPGQEPDVLSASINLTRSLVGESVFCGSPSFPDDDFVLGDQQFLLTAFAVVPEPNSVSFAPGRQEANLTLIDNDGMLVYYYLAVPISISSLILTAFE